MEGPIGGLQLYQEIEHGKVIVNENSEFTILEDKVYRIVQLPHKTLYQVYILESLQHELLQLSHEDPMDGHLGRLKTYRRLQALVYWPKLNIQVKEFI